MIQITHTKQEEDIFALDLRNENINIFRKIWKLGWHRKIYLWAAIISNKTINPSCRVSLFYGLGQ